MKIGFKYGPVKTFSPILKILFIFLFIMCVCEYMPHVFKLLLQSKESTGSPGARVTGGCKLSNADSENRTWVLWKSYVTRHTLAPGSSCLMTTPESYEPKGTFLELHLLGYFVTELKRGEKSLIYLPSSLLVCQGTFKSTHLKDRETEPVSRGD